MVPYKQNVLLMIFYLGGMEDPNLPNVANVE